MNKKFLCEIRFNINSPAFYQIFAFQSKQLCDQVKGNKFKSKKMKPYEIFDFIFHKLFLYCGTPIGHYILDKNFKISIATIIMIGAICLYNILCAYTILFYDLETAIKAFSVVGVGIQV